MRDILKHFVIGLVIGLIASGLMVWSYNVGKRHCSTVETVTDTVKICDTITNMDYDTIYFSHFDTVQLPAVVINDTMLKTDSVFVQIPIETTVYDTIIKDTTHITHLRAVLSGFGTTLDTLTIDTEIMPQKAFLPRKKWYDNFGIGIGIGVGYKDGLLLTPTVGIMYRLK